MKIKSVLIIISASLTICLSGCGNNSNENADNYQTNSSSIENEQKQEDKKSETTISDIENYMLDNGVLTGERTQMAADMVGAIDGFKYNNSSVEIYEYDTNSEQYTALFNGEEIELNGMEGFTVKAISINGKFVLFGEPPQEVIDCFDSFK